MSGMYDLVFQRNSAGPAILAIIGLTPGDVGRYRDCYLICGQIVVYTRNGSANRNASMYEMLSKHPLYVRDADDRLDSTYNTIYFKYPDAVADQLSLVESKVPWDPDTRWKKAIDSIGKRD